MRTLLFLRAFALCGILFALAAVALGMLRGTSPWRSLTGAAGGGLLAGLVAAVLLTVGQEAGLRRHGFDPGRVGLGVDARETIVLPLPADLALDRCVQALEANQRVAAVRLDVDGAAVSGRGRASASSFGERIRCAVQQEPGGTRVEIRSRPMLPGTVADFGRNRRNVEGIRLHLTKPA